MCQDCLCEQRPDRGNICLDDGSYIVNFKSCMLIFIFFLFFHFTSQLELLLPGTVHIEWLFFFNLNPGVVCGKRSLPKNINRIDQEEDDDDDEDDVLETTYKHTCSDCGHHIASHYYRETFAPENVRYMMECFLCGKGAQEKERYRWEYFTSSR